MKKITFLLVVMAVILSSANISAQIWAPKESGLHVRNLADTVGFAQYGWQMHSLFVKIPAEDKAPVKETYKAAICPHDDYSYVGGLYAKTLAGIKAKTIILIGVAHKAKNFKVENRLVFDSFDEWKCADGNIKVSSLRNKLLKRLSPESYVVNDTLMQVEHSLEAINPFLQRNIAHVEILPILVPHMTFENMQIFSQEMSKKIFELMQEEHLVFGKDVAIVISNDGLHYGDQDWGSSNMAPFGTDDEGTAKAVAKDLQIIDDCFKGETTEAKIRKFFDYTVKADNFREYNWTWCGRYSVPFGLLFADKLNLLFTNQLLTANLIDYRSSISNPHIDVKDLGMGTTAPANQHHWVSYVGIVFK